MAFTAAQLQALEDAIASGVQTVEHQGTRTTYQSIDQMIKIRDLMRAELGETSEARRSYATYSRDGAVCVGTGDW